MIDRYITGLQFRSSSFSRINLSIRPPIIQLHHLPPRGGQFLARQRDALPRALDLQPLQEQVHRRHIELLASKVHREDQPRPDLLDHPLRAIGVDGVDPADRYHEHVDLAYGAQIILAEEMAQIAQMTDPQAVYDKAEYGIAAAELPFLFVMKCGHSTKLDPRGEMLPRTPDHLGIPPYGLHVVVVMMFVAHQDHVGLDMGNLISHGLVEGIDDYPRPSRIHDLKTSMSQPGYLHFGSPISL